MISTTQEMTQEQKRLPNWRQVFLLLNMRCPHWAMSMPLTVDGETFKACITCGAHRKFNLETWLEEGGYYFPADERETQWESKS